ncbi:MAG: peptidoglycan D,D-transpeptidase FtsI family protein [Armatimonadota bacterium]
MASDVPHRIHRIFSVVVITFLALLGWQSYWHLFRSDALLEEESNRRLARVERNIPRGVIFDRQGERLAWSESGTRHYADPRATAAVLGYLDPRYGRVGVEGKWDLELAGLSRHFTADGLNRLLNSEQPHGNDMLLTLDLKLQQAALAALGDRKGAFVVLSPATGGILALATSPTFNAETLGKDYANLAKSSDGVLRNRATQDVYPPGSTMKVLTAAAALMHGVDPKTTYTCTGKTPFDGFMITDYHNTAHHTIAMPRALAVSCNNYFARTAAAVGDQDFVATAQAFGFGQQWWKNQKIYPDPRLLPFSIAKSSLASNTVSINTRELANMGFGQSTVVATPLQMAMITAAVANKGTLMAPYLVAELRKGSSKQALQTFHSTPIGFPLDSNAAEQLSGMMRKVVTGGTARGANVSGITVYGKTGTAQQDGGEDHAWFIGFAERKNREGDPERIAFAVVIERGGTGGHVAVPAAKQLLQTWARR